MARVIGLGLIIALWVVCWRHGSVLFWDWWCIPCFIPCRGGRLWSIPFSYAAGHDLLFFVLPKKSRQKKGAPKMATPSLNLCNRAEAGKTRCAQTVPRLFSARLQKFKAPSRAGTSTAKPFVCVSCRGPVCCSVLLRFARTPPLFFAGFASSLAVQARLRLYFDGVAVPCPRWRLEFLLQGGKRKGNCLSEASFSLPLPAT